MILAPGGPGTLKIRLRDPKNRVPNRELPIGTKMLFRLL